ncbi:hypothetical protein, partial [Vibrio parahaemolyticus]
MAVLVCREFCVYGANAVAFVLRCSLLNWALCLFLYNEVNLSMRAIVVSVLAIILAGCAAKGPSAELQ